MSFFSLDEVCFSSFSHTVSIGFNDFKWNKYSVVRGLIIYLVRKYAETMMGLEILVGLLWLWPQFGLKIRGGARAPWPLPWICHWVVNWSALFVETVFKSSFSFSDVLSSGCTAVPCVSWSQLGMQGLR